MQAPARNVVNKTDKKEEQRPPLTVTLKQECAITPFM
jgi:hypothetical protein